MKGDGMIGGVVYCYYNTLNGKRYVGQTTESRYKLRHYKHKYMDGNRDSPFYRAIAKYGYDAFELSILEKDIETNDLLNEREIYWVSYFNTKVPNGYNMTEGGAGARGYKHDPSKIRRGVLHHNYGKPMNPALKEILREKARRPCSEERREKTRNAQLGEKGNQYGKKMLESTKEKLIAAHKLMTGSKNPAARKVRCIETNVVFDTIRDAGKWLDMKGSSNISSVCAGRLKTYGGYHWEYVKGDEPSPLG
jgi:group I intron endonuclease